MYPNFPILLFLYIPNLISLRTNGIQIMHIMQLGGAPSSEKYSRAYCGASSIVWPPHPKSLASDAIRIEIPAVGDQMSLSSTPAIPARITPRNY